MQGKIVKGIAGFYYVHVVESGVYECKAKGIFRKDGVKPLVGDNVEIEDKSQHIYILERFYLLYVFGFAHTAYFDDFSVDHKSSVLNN